MAPTASADGPRPGQHSARRTRLLRRSGYALAALVATTAVVWGTGSYPGHEATRVPPGPAGSPAAAGSDASPVAGAAPGGGPRATTHSPPREVRIPSIGVTAEVGLLGLNDDGTVEVPTDPATTGWYRYGPTPGSRGSSVILGHVDSVNGPAVFADLSRLRPGALVVVALADGSSARFRVRTVSVYPNLAFPAHRVYGLHRHPTLDLVTCGGSYDAAAGGYQANVVVHTYLVDPRHARAVTDGPAALRPAASTA